MNLQEAIEGAEEHYERNEPVHSIALILIGLAREVFEENYQTKVSADGGA
jgi:hypothetical protein